MQREPDFDVVAAHKYFAAYCFNSAWDLIEKADRTEQEDRRMVALSQASIFHWGERADCTDKNRAVGYWQASRVQALLGNAVEARRHGETCFALSGALEPFYVGYAHEALARAALLAGETTLAEEHLAKAQALAARVEKAEDRKLLADDLVELRRRQESR